MTTSSSLNKTLERETRSRKSRAAVSKSKLSAESKPTTSSSALAQFVLPSTKDGCFSSDFLESDETSPLRQRLNLKDQLRNHSRSLDHDSIGKFYVVFFDSKYYYGKVPKLHKPDGDSSDLTVNQVEMTFLYDDSNKSVTVSDHTLGHQTLMSNSFGKILYSMVRCKQD